MSGPIDPRALERRYKQRAQLDGVQAELCAQALAQAAQTGYEVEVWLAGTATPEGLSAALERTNREVEQRLLLRA